MINPSNIDFTLKNFTHPIHVAAFYKEPKREAQPIPEPELPMTKERLHEIIDMFHGNKECNCILTIKIKGGEVIGGVHLENLNHRSLEIISHEEFMKQREAKRKYN